jgi:hypothetical protein
MLVARPPWQGRVLFRSRDVDETRAFFGPNGLRFDPIGTYRTLDVRFDIELPSGIYVAFVHFGAAAVVRAAWETAYAVKLPVQGRSRRHAMRSSAAAWAKALC